MAKIQKKIRYLKYVRKRIDTFDVVTVSVVKFYRVGGLYTRQKKMKRDPITFVKIPRKMKTK